MREAHADKKTAMFLLTRVKSNQSRGSNRLTPRLTQQVPGGGNSVGMQPVSRLATESQSHSARIKYSATSIHLGCCSYSGNIHLVLGRKKKKGGRGNTDREPSCVALEWRRDQYARSLSSQRFKVKLETLAWQMHVCRDVFRHSSETQISQQGA